MKKNLQQQPLFRMTDAVLFCSNLHMRMFSQTLKGGTFFYCSQQDFFSKRNGISWFIKQIFFSIFKKRIALAGSTIIFSFDSQITPGDLRLVTAPSALATPAYSGTTALVWSNAATRGRNICTGAPTPISGNGVDRESAASRQVSPG